MFEDLFEEQEKKLGLSTVMTSTEKSLFEGLFEEKPAKEEITEAKPISSEVEKTPITQEESKLKDIWDSFYVATRSIWQRSKDFFLSAMPNILFKDVKPGDPILPSAGIFPSIGITGMKTPITHTE